MMPRIAILIPNLAPGGSERQAVLLAAVLKRRGMNVSIVVLRGGGALEAHAVANGVPVIPLGRGMAEYAFRLVKYLRRARPDVVYSFLPHANVLATMAGCFASRRRIVWGIRSSDMPLGGYGAKTRLVYALERRLASYPDAIIVNSRAGFDAYADKGYPRNGMVVIENGFDTDLFKPDAAARQRIRAEQALAADDVAIGLPARLDPVKDHETFLAAAAKFLSAGKKARFLCIGGGTPDYAASLRKRARDLGIASHVAWLGNRNDMPDVLNALDIAVMCSRSEGFPNAVGEAMACGVACTVTDVGDAALIVGDTGVVIPVGCAQALASAWQGLLAPTERQKRGRAARDRMVDRFGLVRMADETLKILASSQ